MSFVRPDCGIGFLGMGGIWAGSGVGLPCGFIGLGRAEIFWGVVNGGFEIREKAILQRMNAADSRMYELGSPGKNTFFEIPFMGGKGGPALAYAALCGMPCSVPTTIVG